MRMERRKPNGYLNIFEFEGISSLVGFVETVEVAKGVKCDVYEFVGDKSRDLGIIKIEPGYKTPIQKVLKGDKTVEGYVLGDGKLIIERVDGTNEIYAVGGESVIPLSVDVKVGDTMQWLASEWHFLVAYEICFPPYEDGRYQNLPAEKTVKASK